MSLCIIYLLNQLKCSGSLYLIPSSAALVIFLHLNLHSYTANIRKGKNQKNLKDFIYVRNNLHFPLSNSHGSCMFHKSHKVKFHYIIQLSVIVPKDLLNICKVFYYLIICFFVFYLDYLHYPLFLLTLMIILVTRNYYRKRVSLSASQLSQQSLRMVNIRSQVRIALRLIFYMEL